MLFGILAIGIVAAVGYIVFFWVMKKIYTGERFVDPDQGGTFYRSFWGDIKATGPDTGTTTNQVEEKQDRSEKQGGK